jgi:hypothetical protein
VYSRRRAKTINILFREEREREKRGEKRRGSGEVIKAKIREKREREKIVEELSRVLYAFGEDSVSVFASQSPDYKYPC